MKLAGYEYKERDLLYRLLRNMMTSKNGRGKERWVVIAELLCLGERASRDFCDEFSFNPDEFVLV